MLWLWEKIKGEIGLWEKTVKDTNCSGRIVQERQILRLSVNSVERERDRIVSVHRKGRSKDLGLKMNVKYESSSVCYCRVWFANAFESEKWNFAIHPLAQ